MTQPKFTKGDRIVYGDSVFDIVDFYTDVDLNYEVKWICGDSRARKVCGIPVLCDYNIQRFDDSIHYDPTKFKPFQKVLRRLDDGDSWEADLFSTYKPLCGNQYHCIGGWWKQCIPYDGNDHLLGTHNNCDSYYVTWDKEE